MYTARFSECHELMAHMPADSETVEVNSGWLSMANKHRAVVLISVGDVAGAGTFDVDIEQANTAAGGTPLTLKSTTQLVAADDDVAICIEIRSEELTVSSGYAWIQVEVTPAVAAVEFSVMVLGVTERFKPVSVTAWEEVVA